MDNADRNGIVAKTLMVTLAASTLLFAGGTAANAQQWSVGVQAGYPNYVVDRDDYRYAPRWDRDDAYRDHEQREAFERRQAYLRHEQWEHEQRETQERREAYYRHERMEHAYRFHDDDDRR